MPTPRLHWHTLAGAFVAAVVLSSCTWGEQPPIGGQRDEHGCVTGAGYAYSEEVQACVRDWELNAKQMTAAHTAVQSVGPQEGLTVTEVQKDDCEECFTVRFNLYEEQFNVLIRNGNVVEGLPTKVPKHATFRTWLDTWQDVAPSLQAEEFTLAETRNMQVTDTGARPTAEEFSEPAVQRLSISPSGKKYLNIFAGMGEPDSSVRLYTGTGTWQQVAFCGTPCTYDNAFWLNNNRFVLLGLTEDFTENGAPDCLDVNDAWTCNRRLTVDVYNLRDATHNRYLSEPRRVPRNPITPVKIRRFYESLPEDEREEWQYLLENTAANFNQTGTLVRNNPGMPPDVWHLVYEEPGAPARTVQLRFTDNSRCIDDGQPQLCNSDNFSSGQRAHIRGTREDNTVQVDTLEWER